MVAFLLFFHSVFVRRWAAVELQKQDILEKTNLLEIELARERELIRALEQKIIDYSALKGLTEKLCGVFNLDDTARTFCAEVNKIFGHPDHTVILYLFQDKIGGLGIAASQKNQTEIHLKAKKGDLCDELVVKTLKPLLVEDIKSDFRFDLEKMGRVEDRFVRSLMSVPLLIGNKAIGILRVDSPAANHFSSEDIRLLTAIGDLGAVAIENAQLYERVENLAIHDSLTGLYLRRTMLDRLSYEINRHVHAKAALSFLMVDLDFFKKYNDSFGHTAGDIVLKTVANILSEFFEKPGNLVCRYGGEEFAVILPDCPKKEALNLAQAVRQKIADREILLRREKTHVTVSIGLAVCPTDALTREDLIQKADMALYRAKKGGRNKVVSG